MNIVSNISDTTLWSILNELKPSQQRALGGLDNVTAAGLKGFSMFGTILSQLPNYTNKANCLSAFLEKSKRYLKIEIAQHCQNQSNTTTHCMIYALYK